MLVGDRRMQQWLGAIIKLGTQQSNRGLILEENT